MKSTTKLRRAFTLVELMVTVGLMAMLATMASAGYYAAQRGMADRGAMQAVTSFLKLAAQRAIIDDVPVAVFLSDVAVSVADADGAEVGISAGEMTAVRMAGRISFASSPYIADEFADWDTTYPSVGNDADEQSMCFYRLVNGGSASSCISYVTPYVTDISSRRSDELMVFAHEENKCSNCGGDSPNCVPLAVGSSSFEKTVKIDIADTELETRFKPAPLYGFKVVAGNTKWSVGDAYGFEMAHMRLPNGYKFSTQDLGNNTFSKSVGSPIFFLPSKASFNDELAPMSGGSVTVYTLRPGKTTPERIGSVTANNLKEN